MGSELQHGVGKSSQTPLKSTLLLKKLFHETVRKDASWEKRQKQCKSWLRETLFFKNSAKREMKSSQSFQFLDILERKPPQHPQARHFATDLRHGLLRDKAEVSFQGLFFAL